MLAIGFYRTAGNMKTKAVNSHKIERMSVLALKNAIRLHSDSVVLFNNRSYPSAFFLSVLALEEIGKTFQLMDFYYHSQVDDCRNPATYDVLMSVSPMKEEVNRCKNSPAGSLMLPFRSLNSNALAVRPCMYQ